MVLTRTRSVLGAAALVLVLGGWGVPFRAEGFEFLDDFEDGDALDRSPVCWRQPPLAPSVLDVVEGDLWLRNTNVHTYGMLSHCEPFTGDLSVRALARLQVPAGTEYSEVDLYAHCLLDQLAAARGYVLEMLSWGQLRLVRFAAGTGRHELAQAETGIDLRAQLTFVQLDVRGNTVEGRAWRLGEPMPVNPTVTAVDATYRDGEAGIAAFSHPPHPDFRGIFDSACISTPVSPPPGGLQRPGDANGDGQLDLSDAVWLLGHLFLGTNPKLPCEGGTASSPGEGDLALADANGDGGIDLSDSVSILGFLFLGGPPPALGTECVPIIGCPDNAKCH